MFKEITQLSIQQRKIEPPNSIHWLWDCSVFSVCTLRSIRFWDSNTFDIIETVMLRTYVLNHVIAASKYSANKYVAGTKK